VLLDGEPTGWLYLDRREDEFRIIDIALPPEYRRRGILAKAGEAGLPVRIHVEQNYPGLRLYHHLGFCTIDENGVYYLMEWQPPTL
jgi:ribosomal protein S18 acetylase RimI-like enzyme